MTGWRITYNDRYVEIVPGNDVVDAIWEARRRNKRDLSEIRLIEWQRSVA